MGKRARAPRKRVEDEGEVPQVLGQALDFELPRPAVRYDILDAGNRRASNQRVMAGALGLCWPMLARKVRMQGHEPSYDVAEYGGRVLDYLLEQGASLTEIVKAGTYCYLKAIDDLPGLAGRREVAGNSEPGEASGSS